MAKKKKGSDTGMVGVEGALTRTEQFIEDNQKWIIRIVTGILAVVAIYIGVKRFYLNPMAVVIETYRQILLEGQWPAWGNIGIVVIISIVGIVGAVLLLKRFDRIYPKVIW